MEKQKTILAYGTLRPPLYNYQARKASIKVGKTYTIPGYDMYEIYNYPGVKKGMGEITVTEIKVPDEVFNEINHLEKAFGYEPVELEGKTLFVYTLKVKEQNLVASGDWVKYKNQTK